MNLDYSKFTDKSRNAVARATALTRQHQYAAVDTPIMMVAILQEGNDMAPFILNCMGVDKNDFFLAISDSLRTVGHRTLPQYELSRSMQEVLIASVELARADGNNVAALEYIFWAMGVVDNPVKRVMARFGIDSDKLRMAVHSFRHGHDNDVPQHNDDDLPNLHKYGRNMVMAAENGEIEPVIGRDDEIRRILQIISRKTKNNPILVGEPGTGKTAIIEGLAFKILRGDVPQELKQVKLYSLDIAALVAGAQMQGEFESRLKAVIEEAESDSNIILFVDEIHLLMGAGKSGGAMDAANILKPELARGVLKLIGATTLDEYRQYVEKDKAFERRFQKVLVEEPDVASATTIMRGIKSRFEAHHHVKILDEAIVAAVTLSARYIPERYLPDKAIDLLDEAASGMRIEQSTSPRDIETLRSRIRNKEVEKESLLQDGSEASAAVVATLEREIENLKEQENVLYARWLNERNALQAVQGLAAQLQQLAADREAAQMQGRYRDAAELQRRERAIQARLDAVNAEIDSNDVPIVKAALDEKDIMKVVTAWTGIPMADITSDSSEKLLHIEDALHGSVIGQDRAVKAVSDAVRRNRLGLGDAGRPIGSFLFIGTTGVGKTELCKALAEYLFGSRDMMVRIDMSEYQQEHSVSRLFGAPPGYVGYDAGGQLTEAVRRKPYSVVLFDEIEKAHPRVAETLLQVLDDGRMTDGQGKVVDFKNTIIIMTSNVGQEIIRQNLVEHEVTGGLIENTTELVAAQLKQRMSPEFVNRIDEIVMFMPLGREEIRKLVEIQLKRLQKKFSANDIEINFDSTAIDFLAEKGFNPEFGGRPVKRAINDYVVNNLSIKMLSGEVDRTLPIIVRCNENGLLFGNV